MSRSVSTGSSTSSEFSDQSGFCAGPRDSEGVLSLNESSGEEKEQDKGLFTESFQVDARRLQRMIESDSEVRGASKAEIFFDNIMRKTDTYISWPKKTTGDAGKSNDPYVHIFGKHDDISWARGLVLNYLNTRDKRLKLRIIIPNNDHRFIVGRDNNNLTRIMESTDTIVELPYSNQRNMAQKGNQVTIEGSLDGIERARISLRASMPLLMSFEVPSSHPDPYVDDVREKFNIQVTVAEQTNSTMFFVKGSLKRVDIVKEAIRELINSAFNKHVPKPLVSVQLEIPPLYQDFVKGEDNIKLLDIMECSKTTIFFPDLTINGNTKQRSQVTIIGTIEGVCKARHDLIGNFPIELMFDIPGNYQSSATDILNIGTQCGVCITVAQKERDSGLTITIKGIEKYIQKIYEVYHDIISLRSIVPDTGEPPKAIQLIPEAYRRVMSELVQRYMENVAERPTYAQIQFPENINCDGNLSDTHCYIQEAYAVRELEQFWAFQHDENHAQEQTTYSPDSGHSSDEAFQAEAQPRDWRIFRSECVGTLGNVSLGSAGDKTGEMTANEFAADEEEEEEDQQLPPSDLEPHIGFTGSAAPGAERHRSAF